ncbi:MAG: aldehyde dehydrogenase family protein, partial [Betaproteobacteria bacterium]
MYDRAQVGFPASRDAGSPLIAGERIAGNGPPFTVLDRYRLTPGGTVSTPDPGQVQRALDLAHQAFRRGAPTAFARGDILEKAVDLVARDRDELVRLMQMEAGFTASDALGEAKRCMETLRLSAEEARRLAGDVIPIEGAPGQEGRIGFTLRVPLGIVAAITPFNSPLNTVAHKIAPALAAGNAVILKPSSATPFTALKLAELFIEAGIPPGFLSVVPGGAAVANLLLEDQRVRFFAFTGSTEVGRRIQQAAGLRRTQMELGSIACTILCDDADLDAALPKVVNAAYRKAGQVCTSIQLLLVHASIVDEVKTRLATVVAKLPYGDPRNADTVCGPIISEKEAVRIDASVAHTLTPPR